VHAQSFSLRKRPPNWSVEATPCGVAVVVCEGWCAARRASPPTLARFLSASPLARQLVGVLGQRWHIVGVYPALPLHAACGYLACFALGLALGCCFGGIHAFSSFHTPPHISGFSSLRRTRFAFAPVIALPPMDGWCVNSGSAFVCHQPL
jgi:hypothetical protein